MKTFISAAGTFFGLAISIYALKSIFYIITGFNADIYWIVPYVGLALIYIFNKNNA